MANVLIAGCGRLGTALGLELARAGHEVWGLRRDPSGLPPELRGIAADLAASGGLAELPADVDLAFYTAAADGGDDDAYRAAYVDGPRALVAALAAQDQRPRRLLFTSSTAVYHQRDGEWVDEDSATAPGSFRGARMLEGEAVVAGAPFPTCAVRFGGIYGPGRTWLLDAVRSGRAALPPAGSRPVYTNRIHERDCIGVLAHLAALADLPAVCLGVDSEPAPRAEVVAWLAARLGVEVPVGDDVGGRAFGGNKRCRNARLLETGYALHYPSYREGYGELLGGAPD